MQCSIRLADIRLRVSSREFMKHLLLSLLLASSALADTPVKIAEDYRKAAAAALVKVNETLEKATVPLIATLVKAGDTAGAEELQEQLKAKTAGEAVVKPQASAANIFKLYDAARVKALVPAQSAALTRIDAMLNSKEGKSLDVVSELGKVRAEIEAGKAGEEGGSGLPTEWIYKRTPNDRDEATIWLNPGGKFLIDDGSTKKKGTWKRSAEKDTITIQLEDGDKWTVEITDGVGKIQRPVGIRYMIAK